MMFGGVLFLGLILGVVALAIWAARGAGAGGTPVGRPGVAPDSARRILDERYARGEITLEEYHAMRSELEKSS